MRSVFAGELEPHFVAEERHLLPAVRERSAELGAMCAEILGEHEQMRGLVRKLARPGLSDDDILVVLDRFGRILEEHVRNEERGLYSKVERALDAPSMARLGELLVRPAR